MVAVAVDLRTRNYCQRLYESGIHFGDTVESEEINNTEPWEDVN